MALADWRDLAKRALRKKKLPEGSRSNDWLRRSKEFCELRTFNIFTLHFASYYPSALFFKSNVHGVCLNMLVWPRSIGVKQL